MEEVAENKNYHFQLRYLIILELMHFTSFFNFITNGDNFRNKEQVKGVKVRVGI